MSCLFILYFAASKLFGCRERVVYVTKNETENYNEITSDRNENTPVDSPDGVKINNLLRIFSRSLLSKNFFF